VLDLLAAVADGGDADLSVLRSADEGNRTPDSVECE
jgi:hypothetical protein